LCAEGEARRIGGCPFGVDPTASSLPKRLVVVASRVVWNVRGGTQATPSINLRFLETSLIAFYVVLFGKNKFNNANALFYVGDFVNEI